MQTLRLFYAIFSKSTFWIYVVNDLDGSIELPLLVIFDIVW